MLNTHCIVELSTKMYMDARGGLSHELVAMPLERAAQLAKKWNQNVAVNCPRAATKYEVRTI
jgi:hypothetical protein